MNHKAKKKENDSKAEKSENVVSTQAIAPDLDERRFTAAEMYAWIQTKAGTHQAEISKTLKIGVRQVQRYVKKINDVFKGNLDIEKYRELCFFGNIYQAIDNVGYLLALRDGQMTIAFLRGMGIFKEFVYAEGDGKTSSEEEIRERIRKQAEALGFGLINGSAPTNRISPALAGSEPSQNDQR